MSFIRQIMQIQASPSRREGAGAGVLESAKVSCVYMGSTLTFMFLLNTLHSPSSFTYLHTLECNVALPHTTLIHQDSAVISIMFTHPPQTVTPIVSKNFWQM